jgi:DNA-binding CsgD family transcriptional regulator
MDGQLPRPGHDTSLRGRADECELVDRFAGAVRGGESRILVVRGEAGIGKTALLEYLIASASDLTILRAVGVKAEIELAYAGLHQLCAPLLDRLGGLPEPQRDALEIVFGVRVGTPPDRFFVGLGLLSLLSEAAEERPVVCVIDDAQWLDQTSVLTLVFVARRLLAEPVGIVFAAREPDEELRSFPELELHGLRDGDARALLGSAVRYTLDERVRDRIIAETRGNPLALLELPRGLTATQLAGGFGVAVAAELTGRLERSFVRRLTALPDDARQLLVLASAEPVGDPLLLWRAASGLGIPPGAAGAAEAEGLVAISERVTFRHPLVRSTVYQSASPEERRAAHLALAEATDRDIDPDRGVWHLAAAAAGPDEEVASALEGSAGRARSRGGSGAAAAFLRRALELTGDPARRAGRALAAAYASLEAGEFDAALGLLAAAEGGPAEEFEHALVELLRGQIAFASGRWSDAPPVLLEAARRLEPLNLELAHQTYLDALLAALFAGSFVNAGLMHEIARASLASPPLPEPRRPFDVLREGLSLSLTGGIAAAVPLLSRAARAFAEDEIGTEDGLRWGWAAPGAALTLWDEERWHAIAAGQLRFLRDAGLMHHLPLYLSTMGINTAERGEFAAASAVIAEGNAIATAMGTPTIPTAPVLIAGLRGREPDASSLIAAVTSDARVARQGVTIQWCQRVSAILYNGLGEYAKAFEEAEQAAAQAPEVYIAISTLPELIEAATRTGQMARAIEALERLATATSASNNDWGLGIQARSRALVSEGDQAERCYKEAIERLGRTTLRPDRARAHLVYGEWLRRQQRRVDARDQLRTAFEQFTAIGMEAFGDRARKELLATGEKVRKRSVETRDELTDQERQIAQLARDGLSNPEIGARLFLSPRTVEWHLRKVFGKLGIRSRHELRDALPNADPVPA